MLQSVGQQISKRLCSKNGLLRPNGNGEHVEYDDHLLNFGVSRAIETSSIDWLIEVVVRIALWGRTKSQSKENIFNIHYQKMGHPLVIQYS